MYYGELAHKYIMEIFLKHFTNCYNHEKLIAKLFIDIFFSI